MTNAAQHTPGSWEAEGNARMFEALLDAKRKLEKTLEEIQFGNREDNVEALVQAALDAVMEGLTARLFCMMRNDETEANARIAKS